MKRVALALLLAVGVVQADTTFFSEGFDTCTRGNFTGVLGTPDYVTSGCNSGACCGKQTVTAAQGSDESQFWWKSTSWSMTPFYVRAAWKFPTTFRFASNGSGGFWKAFIFETNTNQNRMFINFNTSDSTHARVTAIVEGPDAAFKYYDQGGSEPYMAADGLWHTVEALWTRAVGVDAGHVKVWFDGVLHIDTALTTCNVEYNSGVCSTIGEFKAGGYQNWIAPGTQSFYLDDVTVTDFAHDAAPAAPTRRLLGAN